MRRLLLCTAMATASPAFAADELKFEKTPAWVVPQAIPADSGKSADAPVALLLADQQIRLEPGKTSTFSEIVMKIEKPEGLSAGNISIPWNPATDTVTVNKLEIRRGSQLIDVIAGGQKFTTMRRESNLELATLDGYLTANIQPEGLQEGDIIDIGTTIERVDPVMGKHVEANFAEWPSMTIQRAHVRVEWPASLKLAIQARGISTPTTTAAGNRVIDVTLPDVEPIISPKGAPPRFTITRLGEATDFTSWADVSRLMEPLFRKAETISSTGSLHDEVEKIRAATTDPKLRAAMALQLVEGRVRYVALLMGQGGYVPADAETTWSRRFGDCKAKTALLLGILHSLGIEAEPILVQSKFGDAIAERLPLISYFDHVLVRARLGGKTYYLDGTRTGDSSLDDIEVPYFGSGLPVVADAKLVPIVPQPRSLPDTQLRIDVDAKGGVLAPARITIDQTFHGDAAVMLNSAYAQLSVAQRNEAFTRAGKGYFDGLSLSNSSLKFDKERRDLTISISGTATLSWKDGWLYVPAVSLAYKPDFDRPAGPAHDAPVANSYPDYTRTSVVLHLPKNFAASQKLPTDVHETVAGIEYSRQARKQGDDLTIETTERSLLPEISYKEALAAAPRLKALDGDDVYLAMPATYGPTDSDVKAVADSEPSSSKEYIRRGLIYLDSRKYDEAVSDFSKALSTEPKNQWALGDRALAYIWKRDFEKADSDLKAAEAIDPDNAVAARARGFMAQMRGDYKGAVEAFTKSLRTDPGNGFALYHRALSYRALDDNAHALADTDEGLKLNHGGDLRLLRANIFVFQGQKDAAAKEAQLLQSENPQSDWAMVAAARIYSRIGMNLEATASFDRAIAIRPAAYIYLNRAQSRPFTASSERLADLDKALSLEPDNLEVLTEKAEELASNGEYKPAVALYDRAIKISPTDTDLALNRATLLYKAGDKGAAEKILGTLRSDAKSATEFNNLCWRQATENILLETALHDCEQAIKLNPKNFAAVDSLAFVKLRLGKIDEAIAFYDQAIANNTGSDSYMGRAIAYARKGDKARAEADRAQALKTDPDAETRFSEYGLKF